MVLEFSFCLFRLVLHKGLLVVTRKFRWPSFASSRYISYLRVPLVWVLAYCFLYFSEREYPILRNVDHITTIAIFRLIR